MEYNYGIMPKQLAVAAILGAFLLGWPCVAQDQQSKAHATQNQSAQPQQVVPPTRVVIDPSSATVHIKAEPDDSKKAPPEKAWKQFLRPEWVIIYITTIYVVIAGLTLWAIKRQADTMETQAADGRKSAADARLVAQGTLDALMKQAAVMEFQAGQMVNQTLSLQSASTAAQQSTEAALLNAKALISAERPWIVLETRIQKSGAFVFSVKNVGKSAAKLTSIRNRIPFITESLADMPDYPAEYELLNHPVLLPPGESHFIGDFSFEDFKGKNPQWASSVQFGGGKSLYIYGRVEYLAMPVRLEGKEIFWETRYCRWYVPMEIPMFIESRCPDRYNEYK